MCFNECASFGRGNKNYIYIYIYFAGIILLKQYIRRCRVNKRTQEDGYSLVMRVFVYNS